MTTHYVEVSEPKIHQYCGVEARQWWMDYRIRADKVGRVDVRSSTMVGDVVRVACDSRTHAVELARLMAERGLLTGVRVWTER
jgi:hypothetical protein